MKGFILVGFGEVNGYVITKPVLSHLLGNTPALQCPVFEESSRSHQLWPKDVICPWVEFAGLRGFASEYGKAFGISVVQDFNNLRTLITQSEIPFIDD